MTPEEIRQKKQRLLKNSIVIILGGGAVTYTILGILGEQLPPGWKDILQGGFVLLWMLFWAIRLVIKGNKIR